MTKVLIVEDESEFAAALKSSLETLGFEVTGSAPTCSAALESLWDNRPDVALVDTHLGTETCEAVLDECRNLGIPVLIANANGVVPDYCGALPVINKPVEHDALHVAMLAVA